MSRPYAIYLCGTDPQCAPCRANEHQLCSWDGDHCQCTACPTERKTANLAALNAELDLGERERDRECPQPCDADCEVGAEHCVNIHLPRHKRTHDPDQCPGGARTR